MINELEIVKFAGNHYALVQDRDDYTANDKTVLRRVRNIEGHFYIKHEGELINLDDDMNCFELNSQQRKKEREWYMKTRWD